MFASDGENEELEEPGTLCIANIPNEEENKQNVIDEDMMSLMVAKITKNVAGTIQALLVTDRVTAAEQSSADWRNLCHLMANNPEIINSKMVQNNEPREALKMMGPDFDDLQKVN